MWLWQMDPSETGTFRKRYAEGYAVHSLPNDLLDAMKHSISKRLEGMLDHFFVSEEFYRGCKKANGMLWRVVNLGKSTYELTNLILERVIWILLAMCDEDELSCVPHYSPQSRAVFRAIVVAFEAHLINLKKHCHVVGFMTKEQAMKEKLRESHAAQALASGGAKKETRNRRNL